MPGAKRVWNLSFSAASPTVARFVTARLAFKPEFDSAILFEQRLQESSMRE